VVLAAYFVVVVAFFVRPLLLLAVVGLGPIGQFARQGTALLATVLHSWNGRDGARLVVSAGELLLWSLIPLGVALFSVGVLRILWRAALSLGRGLRTRREGPLVIDALSADADHGPRSPEPATANEQGLEEVLRRAEDAERERDSLREAVRRLEAALAQHTGDIEAPGEGYVDRTDPPRREWDDAPRPGTSTVRHQVDAQSSDR